MTLWSRLSSWCKAALWRPGMESEMDAELRFHIEAFAEDLMRGGVSREEAMRRARIEFGGIERVKEEGRDARESGFLHDRDYLFSLGDCRGCLHFYGGRCSAFSSTSISRREQIGNALGEQPGSS